jgi:ABC-2 type transport system ATP-binding protein/lipopolysaccharide transport system ATP-binding protein
MKQVWQERSESMAEEQDSEVSNQVRESAEQRWGSGEAIVEDVKFVGEGGDERQVFRTGESFVARISYQAFERVERPTFGVAIYRDDGTHVNGPNSVLDGFFLDEIMGQGRMDYVVPSLPLTPGRYEFTAAIYDHSSAHPYDHRHRAFSFEVQPGSVGAREGIVHIPGSWEHRV